MNAAIFKPDSRLGDQVLHRAGDQYFIGPRLCSYARADMNRDTDDFISNQLVLARMQPRPDLQSERVHGLADSSRALNRPGGRLERGEHSVTGGDYLSSARRAQLSTDRRV